MRWKCVCAYDGRDFAGWQTQDGQLSVQEAIEGALKAVFKTEIRISGSGRTDSGVHAIGQVFHFDFDWAHGATSMRKALSGRLPHSIRVSSIEEVDASFHARFSARSKVYEYKLHLGIPDPFEWNYCWPVSNKLDLNLVKSGMDPMRGEHDFAAFAANRGKEYESTVRNISRLGLELDGPFAKLQFEANGFMYKMARSLVGTLVNVGLGRIEPDEVGRLLDTGKRTPMVQVAPPRGLFLARVFY